MFIIPQVHWDTLLPHLKKRPFTAAQWASHVSRYRQRTLEALSDVTIGAATHGCFDGGVGVVEGGEGVWDGMKLLFIHMFRASFTLSFFFDNKTAPWALVFFFRKNSHLENKKSFFEKKSFLW